MRPLFASAEKVLVKLVFPLIKRKQPHRFTRVCQFASNKSWRVNLQVQLLVASKYRLRPNGSKNNKFSSRLTAVILKDFGSYRAQRILAHICDRGGGFVEAVSFL